MEPTWPPLKRAMTKLYESMALMRGGVSIEIESTREDITAASTGSHEGGERDGQRAVIVNSSRSVSMLINL